MPGNKKASVRPSAQGLTLVTSAILYLAQRSGASAENERFMSLTSECLPGDVINVTLTTPEPFQGLLYARGRPSSCRASNSGPSIVTNLLVHPGIDCGVRREERTHALELDVYVQVDAFVQQVIDEQFLVRCIPGTREAVVGYHKLTNKGGYGGSRDVTVTSKFGSKLEKRKRKIVYPHEAVEDPIVSNLVESDLEVVAESPVWVDKKKKDVLVIDDVPDKPMRANKSSDDEKESLTTGTSSSSRASAPVAWLELVWPGGGDISVGENLTLVVRMNNEEDGDRRAVGQDFGLGLCEAYPVGRSHLTKTIVWEDGCPSSAVVSMTKSFNARTGVKAVKVTFPAFYFFGDRNEGFRMGVRCEVAECAQGACSNGVDMCDDVGNSPKLTSVTKRFELKTHVDLSGVKIQFNHNQDNMRMRQESSKVVGGVMGHRQPPQHEQGSNELLCLSPSRLVLAFGVLLLILVLALLFACALWMRVRASQLWRFRTEAIGNGVLRGKGHNHTPLLRGPRTLPPPPPPPPPPPGPPLSLRRAVAQPLLMQRNSMPYIRVMH